MCFESLTRGHARLECNAAFLGLVDEFTESMVVLVLRSASRHVRILPPTATFVSNASGPPAFDASIVIADGKLTSAAPRTSTRSENSRFC